MIYVDLNQIKLPPDLRKKLEDASTELAGLPKAKRHSYIKSKSSLWSDVKPYLAEVLCKEKYRFKCWYCEVTDIRFDYHVDHFRPKNRVKNKNCNDEPGYWWLAFELSNYRLCCQYCNSPHTGDDDETRGKWDQFPLATGSPRANNPTDNIKDERPLLLDPARASDPRLLAFSDDGRVYPRYLHTDLLKLRATVTIEVLNLNDIRIEEARKRLWLSCTELVKEGAQAMRYYGLSNGSLAAEIEFEKICQKIIDLTSYCSEFSAMARYCFRGTGEEWVLDLI